MPSSFCSFLLMAPLLSLLVLSLMISSSNAQGPPSPGYFPSSKITPISFDQGFRNLWGPQHQRLDQGSLTIWLDSNSGMPMSSQFYLFFSLATIFLVHKKMDKLGWFMLDPPLHCNTASSFEPPWR